MGRKRNNQRYGIGRSWRAACSSKGARGTKGCSVRLFTVWLATILVGVMALVPTTNGQQAGESPSANVQQPVPPRTVPSIEYRNPQYGFCFSLPQDWKGYSILVDEWHGFRDTPQSAVEVARGPIITIRHPKWTPENPRQDIPIMVFTQPQWGAVTNPGTPQWFSVSAAPFLPGELGHNRKYVFALPPRYNYADAKGIEEVGRIIRSHSLHAPCGSH